MLNRRMFLRMAGAFGLSSLCSPARALATPSADLSKLHSSILHPPDPVACPPCYRTSALSEIERLEDVLDDSNCVEVATTLTGNRIQAVSGREGLTLKYRLYCPFCTPPWSPGPTMIVTSSYYWCEGCRIGGTALDFYQRMTDLSYGESMSRLEGLLDSCAIQGHRLEYRYQWRLWEETIRFDHEALLNWPDVEAARIWLREQGISRETWMSFRLDMRPASTLRASLLERGVLSPNSEKAWEALEGCAQDELLLPITDWRGHYWGCLRQPLQHVPGRRGSCTEMIGDISTRRLRRLVFRPPWAVPCLSETLPVVDPRRLGRGGSGERRHTRNAHRSMNPSPADTAYALRTTLAMANNT